MTCIRHADEVHSVFHRAPTSPTHAFEQAGIIWNPGVGLDILDLSLGLFLHGPLTRDSKRVCEVVSLGRLATPAMLSSDSRGPPITSIITPTRWRLMHRTFVCLHMVTAATTITSEKDAGRRCAARWQAGSTLQRQGS